MLYFLFLTLLFLIICICVGWVGKVKISEFMSYEFTNAIKGFAILTVIWAHSGAHLNIGGIQFIAGIGVALFLICSGYGLEKSFDKNGIDGFFEKRLLRVCVPYWIITTLGDFTMPDWSMKVYLEKMIFVKAGWYIKYILVCYFIFYIVKRVKIKYRLSDISEIKTFFAIYTIWFAVDSAFFANPEIPFLAARQMLCFPMGVCIAKSNIVKEKISNFAIMFITWGIGVVFMVVTQLPCVKSLPILISNSISLLTVFPLAIATLVFFDKISWILNNKFVSFSGIMSYELFLVHGYTENLITQSVSSICVCLIVTYGVAYCVHQTLNWKVKKNDGFDCCNINEKRRKKY